MERERRDVDIRKVLRNGLRCRTQGLRIFDVTPHRLANLTRDVKTDSNFSDEADLLPPLAIVTVGVIAAASLAVHLATNAWGPYEFHRDEFLYFAMGEHLRLFSMDFPPFIAMLSEVVRGTLGDSVSAIRLAPAAAGTTLVVMSAVSARLLGGRRFSQGLAAFSVVASVLFLRSANLYQPVVFDQLWWTLSLMALLMLGKTGEPRWWVAFGLAAGVGLLTKFSILILGFATFLALLILPERRWLKTRWPWLAAGIALTIGCPSIVGQIELGMPVVGQMADLSSRQLDRVTYWAFAREQFILHAGTIVAMVGAWALTLDKTWKRQRLLGATAIAAFLTLMFLHGKAYYIGPIYPVLFGAGAVVFERIGATLWGRFVRWGTVAGMSVYLVVLLPLGLPILGPESMEQYLVALGFQEAATTNAGDQERIPQDYADMLNWEEQARVVAEIYHGLSPEDRKKVVILPSNYGEAGAIEFYGPRFGLPRPVSFVGSFWHFGPGELSGDVVILVGHDSNAWEDFFESVEEVASVGHPYAVAEERRIPIQVARNPRMTLQEVWPSLEGIH